MPLQRRSAWKELEWMDDLYLLNYPQCFVSLGDNQNTSVIIASNPWNPPLFTLYSVSCFYQVSVADTRGIHELIRRQPQLEMNSCVADSGIRSALRVIFAAKECLSLLFSWNKCYLLGDSISPSLSPPPWWFQLLWGWPQHGHRSFTDRWGNIKIAENHSVSRGWGSLDKKKARHFGEKSFLMRLWLQTLWFSHAAS